MLTRRIIPCLDVDRGRVVKGVKFFDHVDAGDPVEQAKRYQEDGADELVFYDITASHEEREIMADLVRRVAESVFMPLCVGGGIRTLQDVDDVLRAGADKVTLNSAAIRRPEFISEIARHFGSLDRLHEGLERVRPTVEALAAAEGLPRHAEAVRR